MGNLRKIVGVALAVAVVAGVMVYLLIPKSGTTTNNVVVNEPKTPTNGGSTSTPTSGSDTGGSGSGSTPTPTTPPSSRPPKAHGQNSQGPKHVICLPEKDHPSNGVSQYQGANQYRGECPAGSALGSQSHGQGQGHAANAAPQAAVSARLLHAAPASSGHGNR